MMEVMIEKRFILKCEYFFFPEWLSTAMKLFILYLILFVDKPSTLLFCSSDASQMFHMCAVVLLHNVYMVWYLSSVMDWGVSLQTIWSLEIGLNC